MQSKVFKRSRCGQRRDGGANSHLGQFVKYTSVCTDRVELPSESVAEDESQALSRFVLAFFRNALFN